MPPQTRRTESRFGNRRELANGLLLILLFMGVGLTAIDRMIGDPAAVPKPAEL